MDQKKVSAFENATYRNIAAVIALMLFISVLVLAWQVAGAKGAAKDAADAATTAVKNAEANASAEREQLIGIGDQLLAVTNQIQDCVTPEGKCAQRGDQRTIEAIQSININTTLSVYCGITLAQFTDEQELKNALFACVADEFRKESQ